LANVLDTINKIRSRGEKLITVVGCGGNRDAAKRPEMAKIATRLSDKVILTSDNPRDEDPEAILDEMQAGVEAQHYKKVLRISDRKEAIKVAAALAGPGDVILIAGKGHETYQEIKGVKHPFDDKATIQETFNNSI
jgi:UDP-N-acetylmuramoyl-L-alanyl-D-glutamate--2,6-diaminopimelate ligase